MYNRTLTLALLCLCALQTTAFSQDKLNIKFGKITAADFDLSKQKLIRGQAQLSLPILGIPIMKETVVAGLELFSKDKHELKSLIKTDLMQQMF